MKVAITSGGNNLDSFIDRKFGRCPFFVVYDTSNGGYEMLPNPNAGLVEGAGLASAEMLAGKKVEMVISGDYGQKVKLLFDQLRVQLISMPDETRTVGQIVDLLKRRNPE